MKPALLVLTLLLAIAAQILPASADDAAQVMETRVISQQPQYFHGWPTLAKRADGTLLLVFSGGRQGHICPFGRIDLMISRDEGKTWTFPRTILDTDLDDRDAGILETPKGTLLATTFTSTGYMERMALLRGKIREGAVGPEALSGWDAAHARLTDEQRTTLLGEWVVRSTDGGLTWSAPSPARVSSPHGPIVLKDGRLLYLGKELWTGSKRVGACESTDDGLTWKWLAEIPTRPGDDAAADYHELHAVQAADGRLIAQIRNEGKTNNHETLQTESHDVGRTWSEPHSIGVRGYPSHLLRLRDNRLLMTYGYRKQPGRGNQARISRDGGRSWSAPLIISSDSTADHGYPSTVELSDGSFLTVWYDRSDEHTVTRLKAVLRQVRWKLRTPTDPGPSAGREPRG